MTTHEKLVIARNTLAKRGLSDNCYVDQKGRVCAYGALLVGVYGEGWREVIEHSCYDMEFVEALGFQNPGQLFIWSDESTLEQVLARMDEAIARTAPPPKDPIDTENSLESYAGAV